MIFLLIIITAPVAALLCKNNNSLFPWSGLVEMPPNSFIDLECSGSPNITVSSQAGQLDKTLISKNTTRFSYKSPEIPCFALASGLEIVCASPSSAECRFFIDFDFPLQVQLEHQEQREHRMRQKRQKRQWQQENILRFWI